MPGYNAIVLKDPLTLAEYEWNGLGPEPSDSQCRAANKYFGDAISGSLPLDWVYKPPLVPTIVGRLAFLHAPFNLRWELIVELEPSAMMGTGSYAWIARTARADGASSDAHTESNLLLAWQQMRVTWNQAALTNRPSLEARRFTLLMPS